MGEIRLRTPEEREQFVREMESRYVPCGFCGQMTWPGLRWPALPGMDLPEDHIVRGSLAYVWCCDDCEAHLGEEDDRILTVRVAIEDGAGAQSNDADNDRSEG